MFKKQFKYFEKSSLFINTPTPLARQVGSIFKFICARGKNLRACGGHFLPLGKKCPPQKKNLPLLHQKT
jgi:hypothetical protein